MTIEERWAILAERCWWRSRTDDGDQDHVGAEQNAARDLAMAVLEEAERTGGYDSLAPVGVSLRARITALSRQT